MRRRAVARAWAAVAALSLAGCSNTPDTAPLSAAPATSTVSASASPTSASPTAPPTASGLAVNGTKTSPITWYVKTTGDPAKDAALLAAQQYWSLTTRLHEKPNPADPLLSRVIVEPQLARVVKTVTDMQKAGKTAFGPSTISSQLGAFSTTTARVDSCVDENLTQVYQHDLRLIGVGTLGCNLYQVSLRRIDGVWKAYDQHYTSTCTITKYHQ